MTRILKLPSVSFEQYLRRRGYWLLSFDQAVIKTIHTSFSQKSFCRFWRMWNPFSGYLFFLLYSFLVGSIKRPYAIFIVFITSGFLFHDLVIYMISGSISIVFTVTFSIYSVIFNIEYKLMKLRKRARSVAVSKLVRPLRYHVILNMMLLAVPLAIGFLINFYVFPQSIVNRLFLLNN